MGNYNLPINKKKYDHNKISFDDININKFHHWEVKLQSKRVNWRGRKIKSIKNIQRKD